MEREWTCFFIVGLRATFGINVEFLSVNASDSSSFIGLFTGDSMGKHLYTKYDFMVVSWGFSDGVHSPSLIIALFWVFKFSEVDFHVEDYR